ncbi:hypothetical protein GCM10007977_091410 [Dactylosporangium sucinum]|uniref:Uncharacterized protein n=1 Tax=Dactylosporangium sucinum TaxID=1424081 RepID=A0A917X4X2_9ACTN|nr:hypothetical protein GCM10007977_091410 [Dactylosporangium sucinum]
MLAELGGELRALAEHVLDQGWALAEHVLEQGRTPDAETRVLGIVHSASSLPPPLATVDLSRGDLHAELRPLAPENPADERLTGRMMTVYLARGLTRRDPGVQSPRPCWSPGLTTCTAPPTCSSMRYRWVRYR